MDEKLQTLLNDQVISEYGASMVYTQLAFEMDNLSFPGMREWFMGQAAEEREHADLLRTEYARWRAGKPGLLPDADLLAPPTP